MIKTLMKVSREHGVLQQFNICTIHKCILETKLLSLVQYTNSFLHNL
jgi:hypothetical protein